jgi:hypothetical protein
MYNIPYKSSQESQYTCEPITGVTLVERLAESLLAFMALTKALSGLQQVDTLKGLT